MLKCTFSLMVLRGLSGLCQPADPVLFLFEHGELGLESGVFGGDLMEGLFELKPFGVESFSILVHFPGKNAAEVAGGKIGFDQLDLFAIEWLFAVRIILVLRPPEAVRLVFGGDRSG